MLNFVDSNARPKAYWQATGSNSVIGDIVCHATDEISEKLQKLLNSEKIEAYVDTSVVYPEIHDNPFTVFSFLLMAGYLTMDCVDDLYDGNSFGKLYIPNKEVRVAYEKEIISQLDKVISKGSAVRIQQALWQNDEKTLEGEINKFLMNSVSFFDTSLEGFYHGLMLGFSVLLTEYYEIKSNREEGLGRYDIQLRPNNKSGFGYIFELKAVTEKTDDENVSAKLERLSAQAVAQAAEKQYFAQLKEDHCEGVIVYGVAFYKKTCHVEKKIYKF